MADGYPNLPRSAAPRRRGRPARIPGDAEVRQRLIRTGLAQLTEKGYGASGVDEILRIAGVPKGSFYHYFIDKADFGAHLITAYHGYFVSKLERHLLDAALSPIDRLRAFVTDAEQGMLRHQFRRGCLIGNLGQEMGALPEAFREQLIAALGDWQQRTAACLELAQAAGQIPEKFSCAGLAGFFWTGWEGAVLRAKLEQRADPLHAFANSFFTLICNKEFSS